MERSQRGEASGAWRIGRELGLPFEVVFTNGSRFPKRLIAVALRQAEAGAPG
jgi:hypothetical protein